QELESTLEVAVLLAQALLGALEILPFLAGLLLELGLGGGALLLDLEVDFLEADPSAALGLLLQGLGALPGPRQGGARRALHEERHGGQSRDQQDRYNDR